MSIPLSFPIQHPTPQGNIHQALSTAPVSTFPSHFFPFASLSSSSRTTSPFIPTHHTPYTFFFAIPIHLPVLQVTFAPCFIYLFSYFCKASSFISIHIHNVSLSILLHLFIYPGNIRFLLHFSLLSFSPFLVQPNLLYPFTTRLSCNPTFYPHPPSHSTM